MSDSASISPVRRIHPASGTSRLPVGEEEDMKYPDLTAGDGEFLLNIIGGWEKFQQVKKGLRTIVVKTAGLLKPVATVSLPAVSRFVAKDHFTVGTSEVKIGWLGDTFRKHFLAKVEKGVSALDLAISTLV